MNEFIEQFLIEGRELVEQGVDDLLALERDADDRERLDSAFRAFHTLKGSAGIVDFAAMARGLGAAEDLLSRVRAGDQPVTAALISSCLTGLDQVVQWLDELEATGELPPAADADADRLETLFRSGASVPAADDKIAPRTTPNPTAPAADGLAEIARNLIASQIAMLAAADDDQGLRGRLMSAAAVAANVMRGFDRLRDAETLENAGAASVDAGSIAPLSMALENLLLEAGEPSAADAAPLTAPASARMLRVDMDRIDVLVRLAGEMTVVKNALGHSVSLAEESGHQKALAGKLRDQHALLERLVTELQRAVLGIRVLPMRQVFQRFPRLVRELGASLGKPVRLVLEGEDVEADKVIVESLFEPLLHVVRNAIDHGVEDPGARSAAGKAVLAELRLGAARLGEQVVVEIADDGRGVDVDRVREIAAERGVIAPETLASMNDADAVSLIFAPGFSTAETVTELSGRGVGMDAVRVAVERLGGHVAVESREGAGTTVRFTLPFTLIMAPVMTVQVGGQLFGLPLDGIVETVRVPAHAITPVGAAQAFVLRDRTLPLCDLAESLGLTRTNADRDEATVVVVDLGGQLCGLRVDRAAERMEVMLKPPEGLLSGMPGVAGTTVLGDGRVLIILDVRELFA
jgi:two-component system chemotaxis sensor kinase CheA